MSTDAVPNVLGEVLRTRAFVDTDKLTLQQAVLELAAGITDGPAISRIRRHHEDFADDLGLLS